MRARRRKLKATTLLMVLAIIGLFVTLIGLNFPHLFGRAPEASALSNLRALFSALEMYQPPYPVHPSR